MAAALKDQYGSDVPQHQRGQHAVQVLLDLCVHYVKANGQTRPKVFKFKTLSLHAGGSATLRKVVSLQEMSTRKHYPGEHAVTLRQGVVC